MRIKALVLVALLSCGCANGIGPDPLLYVGSGKNGPGSSDPVERGLTRVAGAIVMAAVIRGILGR